MELPTYLFTRARLINAYSWDLISPEGNFNIGNIFFLKNEFSREFYSSYTLPDNNYLYKTEIDIAAEKHQREEINYLHNKRLVFKISDDNKSITDFEFKLFIKKASIDDIFFTPRHIKSGKLYYSIDKANGAIVGPLYVNYETNAEKLKELTTNGLIYIPTKKQTFEPYKLAKAS